MTIDPERAARFTESTIRYAQRMSSATVEEALPGDLRDNFDAFRQVAAEAGQDAPSLQDFFAQYEAGVREAVGRAVEFGEPLPPSLQDNFERWAERSPGGALFVARERPPPEPARPRPADYVPPENHVHLDPVTPAPEGTVVVATFSAENLFDAELTPGHQDEEFTPTNGYTREVVEQHLENWANRLRSINAGRGPDVAGFTEVESAEGLMEGLVERLPGLGYQTAVLLPSGDRRGIAQALLAKFPLLEPARVLDVTDPHGGTQRGILEATLDVHGIPTTYFVNHWKSMRGDPAAWTEPHRLAAAQVLQARIEALKAQDPDREVVVLGDFNALFGDPSLHSPEGLDVTPSQPKAREREWLFDTLGAAAPVGEPLGTYFFNGDYSPLDRIVVLEQAQPRGLEWVDTAIFAPREMRKGGAVGPPRAFKAGRDLWGTSDHFGLVAWFKLVAPAA